MRRSLLLLSISATLIACGGDNNPSTDLTDRLVPEPSAQPNPITTLVSQSIIGGVDYSKLSAPGVEPSGLKQASEAELTTYLKNGVRLWTAPYFYYDDVVLEEGDVVFNDATPQPLGTPAPRVDTANGSATSAPAVAATEAAAGDSSGASTNAGFSETNVQVAGVDEADYAKYDGQHIFMVSQPGESYVFLDNGAEQALDNTVKIRILATDPSQPEATEVGEIDLETDAWRSSSELYLVSAPDNSTQAVATLNSTVTYFDAVPIPVDSIAIEPAATPSPLNDYVPQYPEEKVEVVLYDVSTPTSPTKDWTLEIDGSVIASRKIGNMMYLVTRHSANVLGTLPYASTEEQLENNEALIANATLQDLLPQVSINGGDEQALLQAEDCWIPEERDTDNGYQGLVTVLAVDLAAKAITSATCLNADVAAVYSSTENFYISATAYQPWETFDSVSVLHKFTLDGSDVQYRATGTVPGNLGWSSPSFRMDEDGDFLRVVTTVHNRRNGDPEHILSVLEDDGEQNVLTPVVTLPNENNPSPIGKPREDIYAVRFLGNRGYIVTFRRTDPLYVIDLSDNRNPNIAGELEVPGFSNYLHPVSDSVLLGIGREADEQGRAMGIKTSLYDVSDISAPSEISNIVVGMQGSEAEATYDSRAISFLQSGDDQLRFTYSISQYGQDYQWENTAFHMYEVNGLSTDTAQLNSAGQAVVATPTEQKPWPSYQYTRTVLHDEAAFFLYDGSVWSSFWGEGESVSGPK